MVTPKTKKGNTMIKQKLIECNILERPKRRDRTIILLINGHFEHQKGVRNLFRAMIGFFALLEMITFYVYFSVI